jgi:nitrate/nitrite transporter NarK
MLRRINLSATAIVLVCFFLPWVQMSCGGVSDTLSGFDLARRDSTLLWLIPLLAAAVLVVRLLRRAGEKPQPFAILSAVSGAITLFLMNEQRAKISGTASLIPAQLTVGSGWALSRRAPWS